MRLDAALRDAAGDTKNCHGCGFENLLKHAFCVLCGAQLGGIASSTATGSSALSQRQRRVRMRKTWSRCIDVEGRAFWFRDAVQPTTTGGIDAVVVGFGDGADVVEPEPQAAPPRAANEEEDKECITIGDGEEADGVEDVQTKVVAAELTTAVATAAAQLSEDVKAHAMRVVRSSAADASRFPVVIASDHSLRAADMKRIVMESQLGFPAKVANFIAQSVSLTSQTSELPSLMVYINRERLLDDSVRLLTHFSRTEVSRRVRIQFDADVGVDAGGVYREWFLLLCEQLVAPSTGVFRCVDTGDQVFYLNPHSRHILGDNHLAHFFATGRFLGRALLEGNVTGIPDAN
ncbi:hypothetical protein ATCC90586_007327 [Pythium insidiosum]|nr:hypothetical protein ATCC90586_007327 [Pythium insidiosum]